MGTWLNSDGLYIKYGTDLGVSGSAAGEYKTFGPARMIEVEVELSELTATETILNDVTWLPANCQIERVDVVTEVAAATGTAIDVGFIRRDRTTEEDYDGLLAAFPTAQMNAVGELISFYESHTVPTTMTGTGALVGQTLANDSFISASRTDATAFTAGRVKIRIHFVPAYLTNN